jgi:hypothetical protein
MDRCTYWMKVFWPELGLFFMIYSSFLPWLIHEGKFFHRRRFSIKMFSGANSGGSARPASTQGSKFSSIQTFLCESSFSRDFFLTICMPLFYFELEYLELTLLSKAKLMKHKTIYSSIHCVISCLVCFSSLMLNLRSLYRSPNELFWVATLHRGREDIRG